MKDGSERVWLSGEVREFLRRVRKEAGVSVSGFIRASVLMRLRGEQGLDGELRRLLLEEELAGLLVESGSLRRVQNNILADYVYLRDYARELVKGAYKNPAYVQLRRSILCYPGADKALTALERVFCRREQIGQRLCEIVAELYPGLKYEQLERLKTEYADEHYCRSVDRSWSLASDKNRSGGENRDGSNT